LPAGLALAFIQDGQLVAWRDGRLMTLAQDANLGEVYLSGDGRFLAYTLHRTLQEGSGFDGGVCSFDLKIAGLQGQGEKLSLDAQTLSLMISPVSFGCGLAARLAWIPGTHRLLLADQENGAMWILDAETGKLEPVPALNLPGVPFVSPDGRWVVIVSRDQVSAFDLSTASVRVLLHFPKPPSYAEGPVYLEPVWSADESLFWLAIPPASAGQKTKLWRFEPAASTASLLAEVDTSSKDVFISPDGKWIAYLGQDFPDAFALYLRAVDSPKAEKVYSGISGTASFLGWSPDSRHFVLMEDNGVSIFYKIGQPKVAGFALEDLNPPVPFRSWLTSDLFLTQTLAIGSISSRQVYPLLDTASSAHNDFPLSFDLVIP
jgi:hypothetical protein